MAGVLPPRAYRVAQSIVTSPTRWRRAWRCTGRCRALPTLPVGWGDVIGRELRTRGIETSPVTADCRARRRRGCRGCGGPMTAGSADTGREGRGWRAGDRRVTALSGVSSGPSVLPLMPSSGAPQPWFRAATGQGGAAPGRPPPAAAVASALSVARRPSPAARVTRAFGPLTVP
jgi:hypothetical protein